MIARLMAFVAVKERAKAAVENATEQAVAVATRIAIRLVAAVFLLIGFIYATVALYLYLVTVMEAWQAMAVVAGVVIVFGMVIFMLGAGSRKKGGESPGARHDRSTAPPSHPRTPSAGGAEADSMAAMAARGGDVGIALHERLRQNPELAAIAALGVGVLIGRSPKARRAVLTLVSAALGARAGKD